MNKGCCPPEIFLKYIALRQAFQETIGECPFIDFTDKPSDQYYSISDIEDNYLKFLISLGGCIFD